MKIPRVERVVVMGWFACLLLGPDAGGAESDRFHLNPLPPAAVSADPALAAASRMSTPRPAAVSTQMGAWLKNQVPASTFFPPRATGLPRKSSPSGWLAAAQLRAGTEGEVQVRIRPGTGTPAEISGALLERAPTRSQRVSLDPGLEVALRFLRANRALLQLEDPEDELALVERFTDVLGRSHFRFEQRYQGLEVWPGELSVHTTRSGDVDRMNGAYVPTPRGVSTVPQWTGSDAVLQARGALGVVGKAVSSSPELIIHGPLQGEPRLAWKFDLSLSVDDLRCCVVDALTGDLLLSLQRICHAAEPGSGTDSLGQTRALNVWKDGTTYMLVDTGKPMYDPTSEPPNLDKTRGAIVILDARNTPPTDSPQEVDQLVHCTSTSATSGWVPDAVSAAFGLSETYDYYRTAHSRNSLDNKGATIVGIVRFGVSYPNAFWSGKAMFFGDNFTRSIDVTGHELTHGVINNTGDGGILTYHNQPGALNEALADIFGEMVEEFAFGPPDWLKGRELDGGPIQNYADPNTLKQGPHINPARMSQFVALPDSPQGDNGGVHINSSIINHAYYLLAVGAPNAVGTADAGRIFYRAMTSHLQKESQFIDMRHACLASAEELFGAETEQVQATAAAFDAVEIFDAPPPTGPGPIAVVDGADATLFLAYLYDAFWGTVDGPYLIRRDPSLGDAELGTVMNTWKLLAESRVSVTGDGSFAVYVTDDLDLGVIETADADGFTADFLGAPGSVWSVAMSPDGERYAFVLLDLFGDPTSQITLYDYPSDTARTLDLYVPLMDGERLDAVQFADAMAFLPDGRTLIYDAYSEFRTQDGAVVGGWTLYAMDLETGQISMLIDLNEGLDFGNPSLGRARPNLLTFEVIDKATGLSEVYAADLRTGETQLIQPVGTAGDLGYPCYTGDDTAIVYTVPDAGTWTGYSLARQPVAADGITPSGSPALWQEDGGIGVIFRRGAYVSVNESPAVTLIKPAAGQSFVPPASIVLEATAGDTDGGVAKVEFFNGSALLGTATTAPYTYIWSNVTSGDHRLTARATDNLGASSDSAVVTVRVAASTVPPRILNPRIVPGGILEFQAQTEPGQTFVVEFSDNLVDWSEIPGVVLTHDSGGFSEPASPASPRRYYRLRSAD